MMAVGPHVGLGGAADGGFSRRRRPLCRARGTVGGRWTEVRGQQKQSNDPGNNQHIPQYANDWAPRTRKRHQREHRPQRPTERSDPTQHAKGRTGDCPGPRKGATTRRNVTQGQRLSAPGRPQARWWSGYGTTHGACSAIGRPMGVPPPPRLCTSTGLSKHRVGVEPLFSGSDVPLASASPDVNRWSRVLLSHTLDAARSY